MGSYLTMEVDGILSFLATWTNLRTSCWRNKANTERQILQILFLCENYNVDLKKESRVATRAWQGVEKGRMRRDDEWLEAHIWEGGTPSNILQHNGMTMVEAINWIFQHIW